MHTTTITLRTADESGAGTDANIFVIFHGLLRASREIRLQDLRELSGRANPFEQGSDDTFKIEHDKPLGLIYYMTIRSDGSYEGAAWKLARISLVQHWEDISVTNIIVTVNKWIEVGTIGMQFPHSNLNVSTSSTHSTSRIEQGRKIS